MSTRPVLLGGTWREATQAGTFQAFDPTQGTVIGEQFPISTAQDVLEAAQKAQEVFGKIRHLPSSIFATFLEAFANRIEANAAAIHEAAALETGLPLMRFQNVEGPRMLKQLRMAAAAARDEGWRCRVVDEGNKIRSEFVPFGPQVCIGPNNFPEAFNGISGGEAAAAFATGCPVIALGHRGHPRTTELLALAAEEARIEVGLPEGFVQLLYGVEPNAWPTLIQARGIGKVNFTGSRKGGMSVITLCSQIGRPHSVEMGAQNAVFVMDSALTDPIELAKLIGNSVLGAAGQFCTKPGLIVLQKGALAKQFEEALVALFRSTEVGPLLSAGTLENLVQGVRVRMRETACLHGADRLNKPGYYYAPTLLKASGRAFLAKPAHHQTDLFGPVAEIVIVNNFDEMMLVAQALEGSLSGGLFTGGADDQSRALYDELTLTMGRPLVNKVPTGVALSPAIMHGGPFPATGDPTATSVGIPRSLGGRLICYDNVPPEFLPA